MTSDSSYLVFHTGDKLLHGYQAEHLIQLHDLPKGVTEALKVETGFTAETSFNLNQITVVAGCSGRA